MPIHSHYCTECLKPEWIAEACQKRRGAVVVDDGLGDGGAEPGHSFGKPGWYTTSVKRQVRDARPFHGEDCNGGGKDDLWLPFTETMAETVGRDDKEDFELLLAVPVDPEVGIFFLKSIFL